MVLQLHSKQGNHFIIERISFSGMVAEEIALGMRVRYSRTGTTGKILRIEKIKGDSFAELDSTSLLYRTDQLMPVSGPEKKSSTTIEDAQKVIAREREFAAGTEFQDMLKNTDHSCEGGDNRKLRFWHHDDCI